MLFEVHHHELDREETLLFCQWHRSKVPEEDSPNMTLSTCERMNFTNRGKNGAMVDHKYNAMNATKRTTTTDSTTTSITIMIITTCVRSRQARWK